MADVDSKPNEQPKYRRVAGLRFGGGRSALRLAGDHLLLCDYRTGFTERYKRFYFRDIEALVVRKTMHWLGGMAIWGFIALCFLIIALGTHWNMFLRVVEGICLFFILRHAIRGPSCRTHIQTAVQTDALPMLKRVRKTNRVLRRSIFPLIEEAQSKREDTAPTAPMSILPSSSPSAAVAVSPTVTPVSIWEASMPVRHELSWFHVCAFTLLLLSGLSAIWEVNYPSNVSFMILIVLFGSTCVCGVGALIRQAKRRVHRGAATMTWLLVISCIIGGVITDWVFTMLDSIAQAKVRLAVPSSGPMVMRPLTPFRLRHMPGFENVLWIYGTGAVLLALLGLIFAFMPAPAKAHPPPLPGEHRA